MCRVACHLHTLQPPGAGANLSAFWRACRFSSFSLFSLFLLFLPDVSVSEELRVLLGAAVPQAVISGEALRVTDGDGRPYFPGNRVVVRAFGSNSSSISKSSSKTPRGRWRSVASRTVSPAGGVERSRAAALAAAAPVAASARCSRLTASLPFGRPVRTVEAKGR